MSDFQYDLPPELIAQYPAERRDDSRLMVLNRETAELRHLRFSDLPDLISEEDLLVLNNSKVFPARLNGKKSDTGARLETLLLRRLEGDVWEALVKPARRAKLSNRIVYVPEVLEAEIVGVPGPDRRIVRFEYEGSFDQLLARFGQVPLPPYIRRADSSMEKLDRLRYQTVYACEAKSVAAPTAGLHFTSELLEQLRSCEITLHVGYGTFRPITSDRVEEHEMEEEYFSVSPQAASTILSQLDSHGRVIAVGTTTTRALESLYRQKGGIVEGAGSTRLFIVPGFEFNVVSGLITNFHLPGSTLLLLVSAFAGAELIREAYRVAVEMRYRFYSYGDAMLIL